MILGERGGREGLGVRRELRNKDRGEDRGDEEREQSNEGRRGTNRDNTGLIHHIQNN